MASERDPLTEPCPADPRPHRWWRRRLHHDWYVRYEHPTTHYRQVSPLSCSGLLLALDAGRREPRCVIFCERCNLEERNQTAPVAEAMYALRDAGQPEMALLVGAAHLNRGRGA